MQILVSSDGQVCCDGELIRRLEGVVEGTLERFSDRITGVDVHLSDLESRKPADRDKSCRLEARLNGMKPVLASHEADTLSEAIHGAADKLRRAIASQIRQSAETAGLRDMDRDADNLFGASASGGRAGDPAG